MCAIYRLLTQVLLRKRMSNCSHILVGSLGRPALGARRAGATDAEDILNLLPPTEPDIFQVIAKFKESDPLRRAIMIRG